MAFLEYSWNVEYAGSGITSAAWVQGFKRLHFTQNVQSKPSFATHTFQCEFSVDGKAMNEQLMREVAGMSRFSEIEFQIVTLGESKERMPKQYHVVYDWQLRTDSNGFLLVLKTMDRTALLTVEAKTRAHIGDRVDDIVLSLLGDHGLHVTTQPCRKIPHFRTLLQRNLTDAQFVMHELLPRAMSDNGQGGYCLFTSNGKEAFFQTLDYNLPVYAPDPHVLQRVREFETNYRASSLGGFKYTVHGFDPFTKKPYVHTAGADVNPTMGSHGPRLPDSHRYEYVPLQTRDAVVAWATERQFSNRYEAYPMVLDMRGVIDLTLPMKIDFSNTKFRESYTFQAPVVQIRHLVSRGRLSHRVTCLRDKMVL